MVSHSRDAGRGRGREQRRGPKQSGGGLSSRQQAAALREHEVDAARIVALQTIMAVRRDDAFANLVLPNLLREHSLTGRDAAFATELAYCSLRARGVLDAIITRAAARPLKDITPELLAVLELGTYQLLFTRVEAHAALDTSVRMARGLGHERATGFINGTLRTISRSDREHWLDEAGPSMGIARTAFRAQHPTWIARSFATALGIDSEEHNAELEEALAADSQRPIVHLVAKPGQISAEELALISGGEEGAYSPYAVYLPEGDPAECPPVKEKLAAVQDEGSQLIARALTEAPLEGTDTGRWLDLCAGPGGKAALIAAIAGIDGATVDAVEPAAHRAKLVRGATEGLPVRVHQADGRSPGLRSGYDRILVDAPCSGLGSLRRRPEARWTKTESDIAELTQLQAELLESAIGLVREGGVIVYSTCSPDVRETREIVDQALERHPELEEVDARQLVAPMADVGEHLSVQMWPHRHGTDAMFCAVVRKKSVS
ncbi:Ribosomal RNA small subunit methyltransferase B [Corynebacterium ciconiae DSM 44920]|nr:Ribosomal RNA small subunit methyltransferase B [Corynebacterium ciconiae DSM 44920]